MKTLSFAHDGLFDGVQIFLRPDWDRDYVEAIGAALRSFYLEPILHWPQKLSLSRAADTYLLALSRAFFGQRDGGPIVMHFDGSLPVSETVAALNKVTEAGFLPALENTIGVSEDALSRRYIEKYVAALVKAERACACIDIPRLWCSKNGPVNEALSRLAFIVGGLSALVEPAMLHLIDTKNEKQERNDWCCLGEGIIPWDDVGATLKVSGIQVKHVILEFEETEMTQKSFSFLERWCSAYLE